MRPKFLDWRFEVRRDRKKKGCKTRSWYAAPERWIDNSDPTGISPIELGNKVRFLGCQLTGGEGTEWSIHWLCDVASLQLQD